MMARAVIRKPEIPCFVLNSQVRVADWEQVSGTHQGQRFNQISRSKAGHRTVLTNRAIRAFFPCKADAIHTGQTGLMLMQLSLLQHSLAPAAVSLWKSQKSTPDLSFNCIIRSYSILRDFRPRTLGFEQDVMWIKVVYHTFAKQRVVIRACC